MLKQRGDKNKVEAIEFYKSLIFWMDVLHHRQEQLANCHFLITFVYNLSELRFLKLAGVIFQIFGKENKYFLCHENHL